MDRRLVRTLAFSSGLVIAAATAHAKSQWLDAFNARYPFADSLNSCGVCHTDFTNFSPLNPYGLAFQSAGGADNPNTAFAAIENADSVGDGTSNIEEIIADSGFHPGWTCDTYFLAANPIPYLRDIVDPSDPGCLGVTTTTLPSALKCAQPVSSGAGPVATDCLFILNVAVGSASCAPDVCVCDPSNDGDVAATDALSGYFDKYTAALFKSDLCHSTYKNPCPLCTAGAVWV